MTDPTTPRLISMLRESERIVQALSTSVAAVSRRVGQSRALIAESLVLMRGMPSAFAAKTPPADAGRADGRAPDDMTPDHSTGPRP